jgi:hypothetical protein
MTQKERMLAAVRGVMPDIIPFAPRIDLWFCANKARGTLPKGYEDAASADEVATREGWALHKIVLEYMNWGEDAVIDHALGIYRIPTQGFFAHLPDTVERRITKQGDSTRIEYVTPKGSVNAELLYTEKMRRSGISEPWIKEHVLKSPNDYPAVGYIFENLRIEPAYDEFLRWSDSVSKHGLAIAYSLTAGSPIHHIMKMLIDTTAFYYQFYDHEVQILELADQIGEYFRNVLEVTAQNPAEIVLIGANFDEMLTYPPFFEKNILPWMQEATSKLHNHGKRVLSHTDGENEGLMDLILESGIDIAEAVCPYPMTKLSIREYYSRWADRITIFGGIPSNLLLEETTSETDFNRFFDDLFPSIAPGSRFILGVADTVPPDANFNRLRRIKKLVEEKGQLPITY